MGSPEGESGWPLSYGALGFTVFFSLPPGLFASLAEWRILKKAHTDLVRSLRGPRS